MNISDFLEKKTDAFNSSFLPLPVLLLIHHNHKRARFIEKLFSILTHSECQQPNITVQNGRAALETL